MNVDDIKRVKQAMTAVDGETAQNMLLGLLLDAYHQSKMDADVEDIEETVLLFVEGTRNV